MKDLSFLCRAYVPSTKSKVQIIERNTKGKHIFLCISEIRDARYEICFMRLRAPFPFGEGWGEAVSNPLTLDIAQASLALSSLNRGFTILNY